MPENGLARMAAESTNLGDYFYLRLTSRKNLATSFGLTLIAAVCLLNIPGLFVTDFDRVFFRCETSEEEISSSEEDG